MASFLKHGIRLGLALGTTTLAATASAQTRPAPPGVPEPLSAEADGAHYAPWKEAHDREADPEPPEFQFISYFFTRGTVTNQLADPSGLRGVSLGPIAVGEGAGSSTRVGKESTNYYIEQRWIPVLAYKPHFVDGYAALRAQFEIDFTWGLAANTIQNNQGGGFNADQVNIQTKNINVALYPTQKPRALSILVGTQPVYDTIYDPTITSLFDVVQTGYKLSFMGTDATGLSAYFNDFYGIGKVSFIPMGAAQPDKALTGDARFSHVYLFTADYAYPVMPGTVVGATYWHLEDRTKGSGYAFEGLVPSGPSSGALSAYTGTAPFAIDKPSGHVEYVGAHFHHNINFHTGPFAASGFTMANFGKFESQAEETQRNREVKVRGVAANAELQYNYGKTVDDRVTLEGMFSSGDSDPTDDTYSSPFTMNYYGIPGAVWFNHKTLLIFPFTSTVSNYTGAVTDISNRGYGLVSGIATGSYDIIPSKLNVKLGGAYAQSMAKPLERNGLQPGRIIGAEVNAEVKYHFRYLMTVGLHGGYMFRGSFYDGNPQITKNPWAGFATFTWYGF
ncbi:MAG: hypothetical protein KC731_09400 [Myxococcales bacterium]|nr:hypothetical protein [Myxococcales bacterium]